MLALLSGCRQGGGGRAEAKVRSESRETGPERVEVRGRVKDGVECEGGDGWRGQGETGLTVVMAR